ncbi:class I SAM-dependent methyltransferase [Limibacter armeniacum]|uniref:class I SAM-dependent methyltransferase n=1 Tax=Limibacter armeniacum TaxID=466084 RepID=UPI002FE59E64
MEFFKCLHPDVIAFINDHLNDDPSQLMLQANRFPEIPMTEVVIQLTGKQKAKDKLPEWYHNDQILYPVKLSMEQCSSTLTGMFKASLVEGETGADLTGGFGVDAVYFADRFKDFYYIEQQEALTKIAAHNFKVLQKDNVEVRCEDGLQFVKQLDEKLSFIYLDPARRGDRNEKVVRIQDCEPNVLEMMDTLLSKADQVMLKLSPMLDIKQAIQQMPNTQKVHVVSVQNECKEIIFILANGDKQPVEICSTNLLKDGSAQTFSYILNEEEYLASNYAETSKKYLYEPSTAILKGGGYKSIGVAYDLEKLHPNSHLYTSDKLVEDFSGRVFECEQAFGFGKKEIKKHLNMKQANITVRNFPLTVAQIRKKTGIQDGGEIYLFATTDIKNQKVILKCKKVLSDRA